MQRKTGGARERWIQALLFMAVCLVGLFLTASVVRSAIQDNAVRRYHQLHDIAVYHAGELDRLLGGYVAASADLAAFVGASGQLTERKFQHYVRESDPFARLPGLSSVGYLPRVAAQDLAQFEQAMRSEFPRFRVWGQRFNVPEYYPLTYAVNPLDPQRVENLRGLDYASVYEREAAMLQALESGKPRSTLSHLAITGRPGSRVVLLFAPVVAPWPESGHPPGAGPRRASSVQGFVFCVIYLDDLFNRFDQSVIRANFDIEVFEEVVNRATVLHDGDGTAQRLQTAPALPLLHRHELEFAGVKWLLYFNQKHAPGIQDMLLAQGGTLGAGILLSLLAAYIAVRVRRHYKALAQEAWQAEKFAVFFEHHPFAVYSLNRQRRFTAVNAQTEKELGVSRDRLLGMSVDQFVIAQHIDNSRAYFQQALQGAAVSYHNMVRSADGTQSNLSVVLVPISVDGKVSSVLGIAKNVTEKKRAELELYRSRQTLQIVLDTIPQLVFWKSVDGVYQGGNRRMLEFAGIRHLDDLIGKTDAQMPWRRYAAAYSVQDRTVVQTGNPLVNHQETQVQPNGTELWIEVNKVPMPGPDGTIDYVLGVVEDITARKKTENELFRRANYDDLTGAATRAYFYLQLDRVLAQHARHARPAALMYFDIDRFKQINDTHGHGVGDRVIQEFVNRISQVLRSSDLLARLGGDEFVLLVEDAQSDGGLRVLAERVIGLMQEPFVINDKTLHVRTSIGIAVYQPGLTADQWVTQADQALYKAKDSGRNRYHFSKSGSE